MAKIVITESARKLALGHVRQLGGVGALMVSWNGPIKDLVRTAEGRPVWKSHSRPFWEASVGSWSEDKSAKLEAEAQEVDGLFVFLDGKAEGSLGTFLVDASDGQFTVTHTNEE